MPSSKKNAILLITCPDQPGLVAAVADFVARRHGNIVHSDQHTDVGTKTFYMRVEWELHEFELEREQIGPAFDRVAQTLQMQWTLYFTDVASRIGIFVSKQGHCLWDLLLRHQAGELSADVAVIISNHPDLEPVAQNFGVPYHHVPVTRETKADAERQSSSLLAEHGVDLIVLARYMQILSPEFVAEHHSQVINVHHSFLPAFVGARPYHQAHQRGVKLIGATAHYVTSDLDEGPIIAQVVDHTSHRDDVGELVRKGRDLEKVVLADAVRLHLARRLLVVGNKTIIFA